MIDKLKAKIQQQAEEYISLSAMLDDAVETVKRLEAENAKLREDAERYRWFRTHENWRDHGPYDTLYEEELDAAIDEARSKT